MPTVSAPGPGRDAIPVTPMRRNRKAHADALSHLAERRSGMFRNGRHAATRYDKTAMSFLGFGDIACIRSWTRRRANTT
jgi:transposase